MTAPAQRRPVVLLRPIPGTSPIHELWAGTKLIVVFGLSVLLTFYPGWVPIGLVAALIALSVWMARVPRGALPSIPHWLWVVIAIGGITGTLGGGAPDIHIGSFAIGLAGLLYFLRITALSLVLLGLGAMMSWTTNVSDVAPAVATLGRPLRRLRIPVDEWAVALALALRAFPMLIDEYRTLYAARRLRPRPVLKTRRARRLWWRAEIIDLITAAITVALRRADEMGDAIAARGGTGQISAAPSGPKWRDAWALLTVVAISAAAIAGELLLGGTRL
ncbi:MAG: energy-coupling factor transport system permease protein [Mycobacterium sp.]|jgi:energy-coupling factor transport system permease protein|nr:energy-coupling factor transport system permease protein [Mycobacterium sp.]